MMARFTPEGLRVAGLLFLALAAIMLAALAFAIVAGAGALELVLYVATVSALVGAAGLSITAAGGLERVRRGGDRR